MRTRRELCRDRLRAWLRHPRRAVPDLRQHLRGRLLGWMGRLAPVLRRLNRSGWAMPPNLVCYAINAPCNLSCCSCDAGTGESSFITRALARSATPRLSVEEFGAVLDSMRPFRPEVFVNAMEPLLTPDLPEHVRRAVGAGLRCTVNTNGTLLEGKARALVEAGLHQILVSLDGPRPEVNDPIRGERAFERTVAGLGALAREKEAAGSHWPEITLCTTISDRNLACLVEMAEFARTLPVQGLAFQHLWTITREMAEGHNRMFPEYPVTAARSGVRMEAVDVGALAEQIRGIRNALAGYPVVFTPDLRDDELETYYHRLMDPVRDARCPVMWQGLQIVPNGDVMVTYACPAHVFGNVRLSPLLEIWNNAAARAYRKRIMGALSPRCARCHDIYA